MIRDARTTDAETIARINVDTWRAAYAGLMPDDLLAGLSYEASTRRWQERLTTSAHHWTLVTEGQTGSLLGYVSGGPSRDESLEYTGEIYALYVLPAFQSQGIGRQLLNAGTTRLREQDLTSMVIWALKGNQPARRFYESMGGTFVMEKEITMNGVSLPEVAYGWQDLHTLVGSQ